MLGIMSRIGIICYRLCYMVGTLLVVLGFLIHISGDTAVYIFYYVFAPVFFIIGFLVKYIFYGNG